MNCDWVQTLTRYDCRQVTDLHGVAALEVGTPFSLHDGSAITLYIIDQGSHIMISDNGDTLFQLAGMGFDVWKPARLKSARDRASPHGMTIHQAGDVRCLAKPEEAAFMFAKAVTGILAIADWASHELQVRPVEHDFPSQVEPYIRARNPDWQFEAKKVVRGASSTEYTFAFRHGQDLIDTISPSAQATGGVMRKFGDVQNGPYADGLSPLVIVDDRFDPQRAEQEVKIIGSIGRAMTFSALKNPSVLH